MTTSKTTFLLQIINDEIAVMTDELTESQGPRDVDLEFPGLETVLRFIAMKVAVPAVASFIGRVAYDQYATVRTR